MTDPRRLLAGGGTELERSLLSSAASDRGSELVRQRALAAFGGAGATALATGAAEAARDAALEAVPATKLGASVIGKWAGIAIALGVAGAGVLMATRSEPVRRAEPALHASPSTPRPAAPPKVTAASSAAPTSIPNQLAAKGTSAPATVNPTPPRAAKTAPRVEVPRAAPPTTAEPEAAGSLLAEVAALDRARRALARGDSTAALSALARHAAEFPKPALRPEATLLRIQALMQRGDTAAARELADRILARQPKGPYAERVRSLIGASPRR